MMRECPHTVQNDTTRCGVGRVGHAAKRPRLYRSDPDFTFTGSNFSRLPLDNNNVAASGELRVAFISTKLVMPGLFNVQHCLAICAWVPVPRPWETETFPSVPSACAGAGAVGQLPSCPTARSEFRNHAF
jgi:hypothetical protein